MGSALGRIRFGVLWVIAGSALAATMVVFFYEPGVLEEGVTGVMEGEAVTMGMAQLMAAMAALPLIMATVTLFLPVRAGAITNLVVGVPLGVLGLFAPVSELAGGTLHAHLILGVLTGAIVWLIVGLSIAELRRLSRGDAASASPEPRVAAQSGTAS